MTCYDPHTVREALIQRFAAAKIGPYSVEYINDAGPYRTTESEHLALVERNGGVTDLVDLGSELFESWIRHYGADCVPERY